MSKTTTRKKIRVTLKPKCPNPLFEKWLQEWKDEAVSKNSTVQYCFGKALTSLKKYPLCLKSGKECGILRNFGTRLCVMLDRKLAEFRKEHLDVPLEDLSMLVPTKGMDNSKTKKKRLESDLGKDQCSSKTGRAKKSKKQCYTPAWRSGPYALMLTLFETSKKSGYPGYMLKDELQILAQPLCDMSFKKPNPDSHYTAWSSMGGLVKKGLVARSGCPVKFSLTPKGEELAKCLYEVHTQDANLTEAGASRNSNDHSPSLPLATFALSASSIVPEPSALSVENIKHVPGPSNNPKESLCKARKKATSEVQPHDTTILVPGSFDVLLLIDKGETHGGPDTVSELSRSGIQFELRHLKVGDYTWVCRDRTSGFEMVLPYIVERKRVDDFAKSIVDGRYHEQKFRLKRCGLPNRIYLVEHHGKVSHTLLPLSTLKQASVNTQVVDGFTVKYTASHHESMVYLAMFTGLLSQLFLGFPGLADFYAILPYFARETVFFCGPDLSLVEEYLRNISYEQRKDTAEYPRIYLNKTIVSCSKNNLPSCDFSNDLVSLMTFDEFNKCAAKKRKFQVREMFIRHLVKLRGLSVEKAMAIVQHYATPRALIAAYKEGNGEKLLADIPQGNLNRLLGPSLSKAIFLLYTSSTLT